jgi:uncharacterized protein YfbU (UPF0304 family)
MSQRDFGIKGRDKMLNEKAVEKAFKAIKAEMGEILLRLARLERERLNKRSKQIITRGYGVKLQLIKRFFKDNQEVAYTCREISDKFEMDYRNTYQRLLYLSKKGFLIKETVGKAVYFKYNTKVK